MEPALQTGLLDCKWIQRLLHENTAFLNKTWENSYCWGKRTLPSLSADIAHVLAKKRRAQNQNWTSGEMIHSCLFEAMVTSRIQWCFVQCSSKYLEGKSPIPRQYNRFGYWQDDYSSKIPACGAICHILSHFPGTMDLQEAEMTVMCSSEKESCVQDRLVCKNMLFHHAKRYWANSF